MYAAGRHGEIPVVKMIEADKNDLRKKAQRLCRMLREKARDAGAGDVDVAVVETDDAIGGGAFPAQKLEGFGVGIRRASRGAESLAAALRAGRVPVIPGVRDGRVVLHVRALLDGDDRVIASSFADILGGAG